MFNKHSGNFDLIPKETIGWVMLTCKNLTNSSKTGAEMLKIRLTFQDGQFAKRGFFVNINSPFDPRSSEDAKKMAIMQITRMLETVKVFNHLDPRSYELFNNPSEADLASFQDADGSIKRFISMQKIGDLIHEKIQGIRVGIQAGQNGGSDNNSVMEFASPNPESGGFKLWQLLNGNGPSEAARAGAFNGQPKGAMVSNPIAHAPAVTPMQPTGSAPMKAAPAWLKGPQPSGAPIGNPLPPVAMPVTQPVPTVTSVAPVAAIPQQAPAVEAPVAAPVSETPRMDAAV